MGEKGILTAMDTWDKLPGIQYVGVRPSREDRQIIIEKNTIRLGFLAYTYYSGGDSIPVAKPWLVSLADRKTMAAEIEALRPRCDFLIVSMHWGSEYALEPNTDQLSLGALLAEQNVDLVLGHHPHVLQRVEYLKRDKGGKTLCFYSLGNFAANQWEKETLLGGLGYVEFIKNGTEMGRAGIIPIITHFEAGFTKTRVYPLYAYTPELMEKHHIRLSGREPAKLDEYYFYSLLTKLSSKVIMYNPFANNEAGGTSPSLPPVSRRPP
jgi:poly-gamma-glutamate synthesis protein (capsule biosynthesis protein)